MTTEQTAVLLGDPPARHLEYADVKARINRELQELEDRIAQERSGLPKSPYERARVLWDRGYSLGEISESTGLPLDRIYGAIVRDR